MKIYNDGKLKVEITKCADCPEMYTSHSFYLKEVRQVCGSIENINNVSIEHRIIDDDQIINDFCTLKENGNENN